MRAGQSGKVWAGLLAAEAILLFFFAGNAQAQTENQKAQSPAQAPQSSAQGPGGQRVSGSISGNVVDQSGGVVAGARVKLSSENRPGNQEVLTGDAGQFSFADVAPGPFQITITAPNLGAQTFSGTLHSGEAFIVPQISLAVATEYTEVRVQPPTEELAEIQIKEEEKQRVFGVVPNFYVSYAHDAAPLNTRQKFELAWKSSIDPFTFFVVGARAGLEQASNQFGGYGQGAEGYGKRYGAAYGDFVIGTFIGSAMLPSLLKQDPRYFYKGTGSKRSRFLYAVANSVICKGDNGRWQPNYSAIIGGLAASGISYSYYPPHDRNGAGLTFENLGIGIAEAAAVNVIQEFFIRKLTPNLPSHNQGKQ
jgi:hypothetical protein